MMPMLVLQPPRPPIRSHLARTSRGSSHIINLLAGVRHCLGSCHLSTVLLSFQQSPPWISPGWGCVAFSALSVLKSLSCIYPTPSDFFNAIFPPPCLIIAVIYSQAVDQLCWPPFWIAPLTSPFCVSQPLTVILLTTTAVLQCIFYLSFFIWKV